MNAVLKAARGEVSAALRRVKNAADIGGIGDRQLLGLFRESPLAQRLVAESRETRNARRAELVADLDRARVAVERDCGALQRKCEQAKEALAAKQAELDLAQRAYDKLHLERITRDRQGQQLMRNAEAELERLAPEAIDEFIARLQSQRDLSRHTIEYAGKNLGDAVGTAARKEQRDFWLEGLRLAQLRAGDLKHTALDGDELFAALNELEAKILELGKAGLGGRAQ